MDLLWCLFALVKYFSLCIYLLFCLFVAYLFTFCLVADIICVLASWAMSATAYYYCWACLAMDALVHGGIMALDFCVPSFFVISCSLECRVVKVFQCPRLLRTWCPFIRSVMGRGAHEV